MIRRIKKMINGGLDEVVRPDPIISFVVIVYDMPTQAENTLISLTSEYQLGVGVDDYEVIIVENESAHNLRREFVESLPGNFSYHLRVESEPTPVQAINFGARLSRGRHICLMIDGARLVTPGVVKHILMAHRMQSNSVVTVPGYHIGERLQQDAVENGYSVDADQALVRSIGWPGNGYSLFDIACFSSSCAPGFFLPNSESNCISMPRHIWMALGALDTRFNLRGGGLVNLDLYKRACEYPGVQHVVLLGEGTFHQFHGGVTTGGVAREIRAQLIQDMEAQYQEIRGEPYVCPATSPVYLGELPRQVLKFVHSSVAPLVETPKKEAPVPIRRAKAIRG